MVEGSMKTILALFFLTACTQKYVDYDLIKKVEFNQKSYSRPITVYQVLPEGKDKVSSCFNQWLFFSNADKEKESAMPMMVRTLCPGKDYLLKTEMTETWWTTILFTRSCIDMETMCAVEKK
jgi:hypothetical protein